jgi:hypothetical protein
MKTRELVVGLTLGLCACVSAFSQGSVVINEDPTVKDPNELNENKYKLSASEQSVMDKYVLPRARVRLKDCRDEEAIVIAGRHTGSFTKQGAEQTVIVYQYCWTGNGLGTAGIVILENGRPIANFIAGQAGLADDSAVLPDIDQNGVDEIQLYYSGGMHQGSGGTGADIFEYSAGRLKGVGWYQADGYDEVGTQWAWKVTVNPGATPVFFKQKYLGNAAGKWRKSGRVLPLKLGTVIANFEAVK